MKKKVLVTKADEKFMATFIDVLEHDGWEIVCSMASEASGRNAGATQDKYKGKYPLFYYQEASYMSATTLMRAACNALTELSLVVLYSRGWNMLNTADFIDSSPGDLARFADKSFLTPLLLAQSTIKVFEAQNFGTLLLISDQGKKAEQKDPLASMPQSAFYALGEGLFGLTSTKPYCVYGIQILSRPKAPANIELAGKFALRIVQDATRSKAGKWNSFSAKLGGLIR